MPQPHAARTPDPGSASDDGTALPADRDEHPHAPKEDGQHRANRDVIGQARRDVESGIQDTERIGTPSDVPPSDRNGG